MIRCSEGFGICNCILIECTNTADDDQPGIRMGNPVGVECIHQTDMAFFRRIAADADKFCIITGQNSGKLIDRNSGFCCFLKSKRFLTALNDTLIVMTVVDHSYFGRICANAMDRGIENIFAYGNDMVIFLISFPKKIDILVSLGADLVSHIIVNPDCSSAW